MLNKRHTGWTAIIIKTVMVMTIVMLNFGTVLADPTTPATPPPATTSTPSTPTSSTTTGMSQFNVGKYLSISGQSTAADNKTINFDPNVGLKGDQNQAYLKSNNPVGAFILQIINLIALTAASLSFLAVVVAGFLMMSAAGEVNQLNRGKDILAKALIGLVITLSAYFIVAFVQNLLFETVAK